MIVRDATARDLQGILAIYNEVVSTSTAIYALHPVELDDRRAWMAARQDQGYPVMVAVDGEAILGYAAFGDWRGSWHGYRYTVEHSVHVTAERRGQGLGRALVQSLFPRALALGKHAMLGAVDSDNAGSLRFHAKLGFREAGRFNEVGHKFGRWLDLVFVHRLLDAPGSPRG